MMEKIVEAGRFIRSKCDIEPSLGLVLGSGLGLFAEEIEAAAVIPYGEIPNFAKTTVQGHDGQLVLGHYKGIPLAIMQGRFHYYEGYPMSVVTLPTRVISSLGIHTLIVTNAAGGVNTEFQPGELMLISDHLNLMGTNPLIGDNLEPGPRFPDMTRAYSDECREVFRSAAESLGVGLREGIYAAVTGPSYETPAEVRMLRTLGADAVGMSTVPEAIVANHCGVRVCGVSCITNMAAGITGETLTHDEVKETAEHSIGGFIDLLKASIPRLAER